MSQLVMREFILGWDEDYLDRLLVWKHVFGHCCLGPRIYITYWKHAFGRCCLGPRIYYISEYSLPLSGHRKKKVYIFR